MSERSERGMLGRRAVAALAAGAAGAVVLTPVGEVLFYGLEGFPVEADAKGVFRILSATGAIVLLAVGAAAAARVPVWARGWPTVAAGLLVSGLLTAYGPLDPDSALGELHPLVRPLSALIGGLVIGAAIVAVLPATPGTGDPWPLAAFAAAMVAGVPVAPTFLPQFPELHFSLGWADLVALVLATVAAFVAPRPAAEPGTPGVGPVTRVALLGAVVAAAFHMEYLGRSTEGSPAAVVGLVLLLTVAVWVAMTWVLVGWSGRVAGAGAARVALTCAGAAGALFVGSGRGQGVVWAAPWVSLLAIAAAVVAVVLTRRRPALPWDAYGLAVAGLAALLITTMPDMNTGYYVAGVPVGAFVLGAALARTNAAGALCGLLALLLTLPVLIATATQIERLLRAREALEPGTTGLALLYAPIWLVALLTAVLLARRPTATSSAPAPLPAG